ncbi:MAG: serine/threonine-protein kinase [bacterium]
MTPEERHRLFKQLEGYAIAGRFVLEELIGMGGMAAVFRARQSNVNRQVAIKLIPADDPLLVARFEREAGMVSQLSHPNNVTMFDFGHTEDGYVFLAMELLNGETLEQRILRGPIPLETTLHIAEQLCHALGEAHERGVVHRDVKPENIFLVAFQGDDAFVKVLDFGIAKSLDSRSYPSLTGEGRIIGTPRYMSPEQILGDDIDQRSDIYSLGCVLYQMLAGQPPFDAENSATLMLKHAQDMPPEFSDVAPSRQVPKHIEGIVRRMLAKTPGDRPASLEFVRQELMTEVSPDTDRATSDVETPNPRYHGDHRAVGRDDVPSDRGRRPTRVASFDLDAASTRRG